MKTDTFFRKSVKDGGVLCRILESDDLELPWYKRMVLYGHELQTLLRKCKACGMRTEQFLGQTNPELCRARKEHED